ncbi:hypothetical protein AKUG0406_PLPX00310 (plasmid) [Apilactobacillus kunkeei]|nr:hypothetical protein AKUG0406_PLPX00310 [Apilactobacillus kunkeei]
MDMRGLVLQIRSWIIKYMYLKQAGAKKIYKEKFTGTTVERPEFQKLISVIETGDTLIVTKLDRFARNTKEALISYKSYLI